MTLYGKNAVKVGDTLYGFANGIFRRGKKPVDTVSVQKVGRKYFYVGHWRKLEIVYNKQFMPQFGEPIAIDADPNNGYQFYLTEESMRRGLEVRDLANELSRYNFKKANQHDILKIAAILKIGIKK